MTTETEDRDITRVNALSLAELRNALIWLSGYDGCAFDRAVSSATRFRQEV